jgi:hypothetical protein
MVTGAQRGFFGPTNKDNAVGATRNNFCTHVDNRIQRPVFGPKKPEPMPTDTPPVTSPIVNAEKGRPSKAAYTAIGDVTVSRPKDFFDLQLSPGYISNIRKGTNYRASAEGVGTGVLGNEMKDFGNTSSGWQSGCQMFGLTFIWTVCLTHKSCFLPFTLQSV